MKIELQLTQPTTGKILKDLGVRLKANHYWRWLNSGKWRLTDDRQLDLNRYGSVPAYTIAELGAMIPWGFFQKVVVHKMPGGFWQCLLSDNKAHSFALEVEARAFYLIDLIRSGQVTVDEINYPEKYNVIMPGGKPYPKQSEK